MEQKIRFIPSQRKVSGNTDSGVLEKHSGK